MESSGSAEGYAAEEAFASGAGQSGMRKAGGPDNGFVWQIQGIKPSSNPKPKIQPQI